MTAEAFRQVAAIRDGEAVFRRFVDNMLARRWVKVKVYGARVAMLPPLGNPGYPDFPVDEVENRAIRKSGLKRDQSSPASILRMSVEMSAP